MMKTNMDKIIKKTETDFGMPTLIENSCIEEAAVLCHSLGLRFIELNMNLPDYQTERIDLSRLKEIADKYGIYYTIHLDENLKICDFNRKVVKAYTETVLETIEIAKQLSAPILNMHFHEGVYFTLPDKKAYLLKQFENQYEEMLKNFRNTCDAAIGGSEIRICIENTRSFMLDFVEKGIGILLKSPVFGLTFDTGHNAGSGFKQFPLIERNIDRLYHMHLHDHSKDKGDHLPLGEGKLDIAEYLALAQNHNCRVLLETKTVEGVKKSAEWLKK